MIKLLNAIIALSAIFFKVDEWARSVLLEIEKKRDEKAINDAFSSGDANRLNDIFMRNKKD